MDLYNFFLGFVFCVCGFIFMIKEMTNAKKPIDMFRIQIFGGLLISIIAGIYIMYSEIQKIL